MSSFKRKYKKLIRDPKLFFKDMLVKHHKKINFLKGRKKYDGKNQFTVVSAVYGVENYLNDYFESLVKQNLDFKKHIHLIMVDDGSTDNSAEIIKKWQKKYPKNITYIYKENGGQASARNLGLKFVKTKWVTFIDPDDFIDRDYFLSINNFLEGTQENIALIGCNLYFYIESQKKYQNTHPLKYKFNNELKIYSCLDLKENIQMSSSSAIFLTQIIQEHDLFFNEKIKPSFEDASFIGFYLSYAGSKRKTTFLSKPKYFYRKRSDNSSTLDNAWQDKRKYNDVFIHGYLPLLSYYNEKYGKVPVHIQRKVLYDLIWYLKYLINNDDKLHFLNKLEIDQFLQYISQAFSFIDDKTILEFNLARVWFYHKVLILNAFKNSNNFKQISYIERASQLNKQILVSFIANIDAEVLFLINNQELIPVSGKILPQYFATKQIGSIHYYYLQLDHGMVSNLKIIINGKVSRISLKGQMHADKMPIKDIFNQLFSDISKSIDETPWILMDRDTIADDNAEHLYRYIMKNHPQKNIYYALRKSSKDWDRLRVDGFNLIDFGSEEHHEILANSSRVISSHAEKYVHNYLPNNEMMNKSFVFLQHGIIKDDLSSWLNTKKNMDLFITSTESEYESIANLDSPYMFTKREVKLTGLPRHDYLWENRNVNSKNKTLLIMPTWRSSIVGDLVENSNERLRNKNFENSDFFKYWYSFIHSQNLFEMVTKYGVTVIFAPHKNIELYLDSFNVPDYMLVRNSQAKESMQQLFLEANFLVTDYSSVAFELAYLNKSTIYYQFDEEEVFSGSHTYQKGYFDYERDGFGPKVNTEEQLLMELEKLCKRNGVIEEKYLNRIKNTFAYQDAGNCKRVYEAICDLDNPLTSNENLDILEEFAKRSVLLGNQENAVNRCEKLLQLGNNKQKHWAYTQLLNLYYDVQLFEKLEYVMNEYFKVDPIETQRAQGRLEMLRENWEVAFSIFTKIENKTFNDYLNIIKVCAFLGLKQEFIDYARKWESLQENNNITKKIILIYNKVLTRSWKDVESFIKSTLANFSWDELKKYKLHLLASKASRELNNKQVANAYLVNYEQYVKNDHECRSEIAHLSYLNKNYKKVVSQLEQGYKGQIQYMSLDLVCIYAESLFNIQQFNTYKDVFGYIEQMFADMLPVIDLKLSIARKKEDWEILTAYKEEILTIDKLKRHLFSLLMALNNKGNEIETLALAKNIENDISSHDMKAYLIMLSELAILQHEWSVAEKALKNLLHVSHQNSESIWNKILHVQIMQGLK